MGRTGVARGGKDAVYQPPIDTHRKRIGQETRKEKLMNKEVRRHQQARDNQTEDFKDSLLILLAVVGVFGAVYLILFFAVRKNPSEDV